MVDGATRLERRTGEVDRPGRELRPTGCVDSSASFWDSDLRDFSDPIAPVFQSGVFTIGIAVALAEHRLQVEFLSDPDPDVQPMERRLYARARRLGVEFRPAVGIRQLTVALRQGRHPIVFYRAIDGEGHFSPVAAISNGFVELPHDNRGRLSVARFRIAWREPGFLRQTVIATRPPNQRLHPSAAGGSGLMEEIT